VARLRKPPSEPPIDWAEHARRWKLVEAMPAGAERDDLERELRNIEAPALLAEYRDRADGTVARTVD
jgi:hypothetical protein